MLKGYKYFGSTSIPDKTNEEIFLKSPKNIFWVIFAKRELFQKKSGSVTHIPIWVPNNTQSFRKSY